MGKMTMNFGGKDMEVDDLVARMPKSGKPPSLNDIKPLPNAKPTKPGEYKKYTTPVKASGTDEGTDQASANRNLPNDFANVMQDERNKKGMQNYEREKKFKSGGKVSSASGRADGIAQKGKTKGKIIAMCGGGMYKK